jgi:hypothetical protein
VGVVEHLVDRVEREGEILEGEERQVAAVDRRARAHVGVGDALGNRADAGDG